MLFKIFLLSLALRLGILWGNIIDKKEAKIETSNHYFLSEIRCFWLLRIRMNVKFWLKGKESLK